MDFIIQKVNNRDVSNLSHTDALKVFEEAQEPIIVQVLRRKKDTVSECHSTDQTQVDIPPKATQSTQTDISLTGVEWGFGGSWSPDLSDCGSPEGDYVFPGDLPQSISQYMEQEVDIEEILLERESQEDLLGLTLYYTHSASSTESANQSKDSKEASATVVGTSDSTKDPTKKDSTKTIEVLVSQIEPGSVAAKDGRLRIGDQILQINGEELIDKDQTQKIFRSPINKFALVVSRTQYYDEDDLQEGVVEDLIEEQEDIEVLDANSEFTTARFDSSKPDQPKKKLLETTIEEKEELSSPAYSSSSSTVSSPSSTQKPEKLMDKKVHKPVESPNMTESKPKETTDTYRDPLPIPIRNRPAIPVPCATDSEHIYESIPEESEDEPIYCLPYESTCPPKLPPPKQDGTGKSSDSSRSSGSRHDRGPHRPSGNGKVKTPSDERDSSSAYNTEESTGSNPKQRLELSLGVDSALRLSTLRLSARNNHPNTTKIPYKEMACSTCPKCVEESEVKPSYPCTIDSPCQSYSINSHDQTKRKDKNYVSFAHNQTLYTNPANLNQTIWLQQQLFRQALVKRQQSRNTDYNSTKQQPLSNKSKDAAQSEWKVKIRPDGTRYITHRPIRNKILKERANRINEDRIGLTTDDDAMSEIKVGRYWSKEERKKQYERERLRKRTQEARKQTRPVVMAVPELPQLTKWVPVLEVNAKSNNEVLNKKPLYPPHYPHLVNSPTTPLSHFAIPPPPKGMLSVTTV